MSGPERRRRAALAQNLFASPAPAQALVRAAGMRPGDRVYDLGAGTGLVTAALVKAGARVVAVERDPNLARKLRARFEGQPVEVIEADLATVAFRAPFKVVANPPFNRTAVLLRRLLLETPGPDAAALVLQREAARKYASAPRPTAVSLMAAPWFEARIAGAFARSDFVPRPSVDTALLVLTRRSPPDLPASLAEPWRAFVAHALARPQPDAWRSLRDLVSHLQWRRLAAELGLPADATRADLAYEDWLAIFRFVLAHAPERRRQRLLSRRIPPASAGNPEPGGSWPPPRRRRPPPPRGD